METELISGDHIVLGGVRDDIVKLWNIAVNCVRHSMFTSYFIFLFHFFLTYTEGNRQ